MQLCICKHVHGIHAHCFISFATINETFNEIVILYALINQLNLLLWVWFKRYAVSRQVCISKHVHSIHTHRFKSFATICETFNEIVILYGLINQLNLLLWVWFKRYAVSRQVCISKHVHSIHTHRFKSFATICETFNEIVILYAHGALKCHTSEVTSSTSTELDF